MRTLFHTVLFWTYFALCMPIFFAIALPLWLVTLPFDPNGRILHGFTCLWGGQYVFMNPMWRLHVEGRERVDRKRAYVLCSSHQSSGDIPVLFGLFLPFKFVSKAINFKAPFLGWNMTLNRYIPLVRGDKASVLKMMATCRSWLDRGVSGRSHRHLRDHRRRAAECRPQSEGSRPRLRADLRAGGVEGLRRRSGAPDQG
jgi:1-acyl-sn-glycerol-3-phosphate acyltransferase